MGRYILIVFALLGAPSGAEAELVCTLDVTPVRFETIAGTSAGTFDARGALAVACTGSQGARIAACLEISQDAAVTWGQRLLSAARGSAQLPIQVFQDAALTRPWNDAALLQRTGDGVMTATAYVRAYVQKGRAAPGAYSAQFPVTMRYGAVAGAFADCNALGDVAAAAGAPGPKTVGTVSAHGRKR